MFAYDAHKIDVFGPDGLHLYDVSPQVAGSGVGHIDNAAVDTDGTIAGAVDYSRDGSSRNISGGIALFDRSGKQVLFFDTRPFFPTQVSFGPDHSIWTLGWPGPGLGRWGDDFFILRNYSQDGRELGRFLPRSAFDPERDPVGPLVGMWELRVIGNRVGAVLYASSIYRPGQSPRPT